MAELIPAGSLLRRMPNGDVLITQPNAQVPWLCVEQDRQQVRTAIFRQPVDQALAEAARRYVQNNQPQV